MGESRSRTCTKCGAINEATSPGCTNCGTEFPAQASTPQRPGPTPCAANGCVLPATLHFGGMSTCSFHDELAPQEFDPVTRRVKLMVPLLRILYRAPLWDPYDWKVGKYRTSIIEAARACDFPETDKGEGESPETYRARLLQEFEPLGGENERTYQARLYRLLRDLIRTDRTRRARPAAPVKEDK
jgi:hypothetical protein